MRKYTLLLSLIVMTACSHNEAGQQQDDSPNQDSLAVEASDSLSCELGRGEAPERGLRVSEPTAPIRRDTTLLDLYYAMERDGNRGMHYTGRDTVLDKMPGLIKWQRTGDWYYSGYYVGYYSQASLCIYFDSLYPSVEVMRRVAVEADLRFHSEFITSRVFEVPDTTVCLDPSVCFTPQDVIGYFERQFEVVHNRNKTSNVRIRGNDFRDAIIVCRQYHDDLYSTYLIQSTYDWIGSCGCCSMSQFFTYDRMGNRLRYYDVFKPNTKYQVLRLIKKAYKKRMKEDAWHPWSVNDVGDNFALVEEGILFYYEPYTIGCGADGQFNFLIKYEDLIGLMKIKIGL